MKIHYLTALLILSVPSAASTTAAVVIDSFQDPEALSASSPSFFNDGYNESLISQILPHVVGGRALGIFMDTGNTGIGDAAATIAVVNGMPSLTFMSSGDSLFTLAYGAGNGFFSTGGPTMPSPMDLQVQSLQDYLQLVFSSYSRTDGRNLIIDTYLQTQSFQITLDTHQSTNGVTPIVTTLDIDGPQTIDIPLSSLSGNDLNAITFAFNAPANTNFQLESIALVSAAPEPSTLFILAIALPLLWRRVSRNCSN
jgi:hypothetical protein